MSRPKSRAKSRQKSTKQVTQLEESAPPKATAPSTRKIIPSSPESTSVYLNESVTQSASQKKGRSTYQPQHSAKDHEAVTAMVLYEPDEAGKNPTTPNPHAMIVFDESTIHTNSERQMVLYDESREPLHDDRALILRERLPYGYISPDSENRFMASPQYAVSTSPPEISQNLSYSYSESGVTMEPDDILTTASSLTADDMTFATHYGTPIMMGGAQWTEQDQRMLEDLQQWQKQATGGGNLHDHSLPNDYNLDPDDDGYPSVASGDPNYQHVFRDDSQSGSGTTPHSSSIQSDFGRQYDSVSSAPTEQKELPTMGDAKIITRQKRDSSMLLAVSQMNRIIDKTNQGPSPTGLSENSDPVKVLPPAPATMRGSSFKVLATKGNEQTKTLDPVSLRAVSPQTNTERTPSPLKSSMRKSSRKFFPEGGDDGDDNTVNGRPSVVVLGGTPKSSNEPIVGSRRKSAKTGGMFWSLRRNRSEKDGLGNEDNNDLEVNDQVESPLSSEPAEPDTEDKSQGIEKKALSFRIVGVEGHDSPETPNKVSPTNTEPTCVSLSPESKDSPTADGSPQYISPNQVYKDKEPSPDVVKAKLKQRQQQKQAPKYTTPAIEQLRIRKAAATSRADRVQSLRKARQHSLLQSSTDPDQISYQSDDSLLRLQEQAQSAMTQIATNTSMPYLKGSTLSNTTGSTAVNGLECSDGSRIRNKLFHPRRLERIVRFASLSIQTGSDYPSNAASVSSNGCSSSSSSREPLSSSSEEASSAHEKRYVSPSPVMQAMDALESLESRKARLRAKMNTAFVSTKAVVPKPISTTC